MGWVLAPLRSWFGGAYQTLSASRRYRRHIRHRAHRLRTQVQNRISNYIVCLRLLREGYYDAAGPDNSCFLTGDFGYRIAQEFLVVERNVGDHTDARLNYVGRIQPPAHTYFQHGHL